MVDLIHALFDQKNEGKSQQQMVFHTPHSNIHSNIQKNSNQIDQTMKLTYTNREHCILLREALPSWRARGAQVCSITVTRMSDFISDMIRQDLTYLMGGVVNKGSSGLVSCIWRKSRGRLELSSETSFGRRDNEEVLVPKLTT